MRLLLVFAVLILSQGAWGKNALLKGTGIASSHGGFLAFGPKTDFISRVVLDVSSRGVDLDSDDGRRLSRLGYKLEYDDGHEETLALVFQDGGEAKLLHHHSADKYPDPKAFGTSGTWSVEERSQRHVLDDELDIKVEFGKENGPKLKIFIVLRDITTTLVEGVTGEMHKIPDAKATINVVSSPGQGDRDIPTYEWDFSSLLDLNTLRETDNSADQLAKELLGY